MSLRTKLFQDSVGLQRTCQLSKNNTAWDPESFKLPDLGRFVFSSPWSPRHHVTQSTEVLGWVFPMDWCFPPVEGVLTPVKFSLKTVDVWNKAVFRCILQEKLESLVRVLHVPEEICLSRRWVVAPQLQRGSFRDSDVATGLVTDWDLAPPEASALNQWTRLKQKVSLQSQIGTMLHAQTRE